MTPPIRFLAAAFGSWACLRGIMLLPSPAEAPRQEPVEAVASARLPSLPPADARPHILFSNSAAATVELSRSAPATGAASRAVTPQPLPRPLAGQPPVFVRSRLIEWDLPSLSTGYKGLDVGSPVQVFASPAATPPPVSRWTGAVWFHGRTGDGPGLAPGGLLGSSQAGARIGYRLSPELQFTARVTGPLGRVAGAEAAVGVEWQPVDQVPLRVLAERRQRLAGGGREAFAVTLHGGVSEMPMPAGFRLEAYAQAGAVGARSRDLFAETSVRAAKPLGGGLRLGAGVWGAAQPGAARLDIGPSATLRLPQLRVSLSADWRIRAAGKARPGSGPALTLWTDF